MTYLDNNIVNVAIPTIQRSLHLSVSGLEWVVSSYLLTLAGLLLVGGRLADVYGRRRVFQLGLAVFTAVLAGRGPGRQRQRAHRQPRRPGHRRGAADARHTGHHRGRVHRRQGTQHGHRHLGRGRGAGPRARPGAGRPDQPASALGLDLPDQRADRRDHLRHRRAVRDRIPDRIPGWIPGWIPGRIPGCIPGRIRGPAARPARPGHLRCGLVRADLRADRGERPGLDLPAHPRRVRAGRGGRRGLPGHRVPRRRAQWSRCPCSAAGSSAAAPPR